MFLYKFESNIRYKDKYASKKTGLIYYANCVLYTDTLIVCSSFLKMNIEKRNRRKKEKQMAKELSKKVSIFNLIKNQCFILSVFIIKCLAKKTKHGFGVFSLEILILLANSA